MYLVVLPVVSRRAVCYAIFVGSGGRTCGHACRSDSETHPRLGGAYHVVDGDDHAVHIVAAPVALRECSAGCGVSLIEVGVERKVGAARGIEIVVEEHSVHVVVCDDFADNIHDSLRNLRQPWIYHDIRAIRQKPVGVVAAVIHVAPL